MGVPYCPSHSSVLMDFHPCVPPSSHARPSGVLSIFWPQDQGWAARRIGIACYCRNLGATFLKTVYPPPFGTCLLPPAFKESVTGNPLDCTRGGSQVQLLPPSHSHQKGRPGGYRISVFWEEGKRCRVVSTQPTRKTSSYSRRSPALCFSSSSTVVVKFRSCSPLPNMGWNSNEAWTAREMVADGSDGLRP